MATVERSYLFVPADRCDRLQKAFASGADAVVADLEDAVPPEGKDRARDALAEWLEQPRSRASGPPLVVRINAASTPWFMSDVALCRRNGVQAVMLPKAENAALVSTTHAASGLKPVIPLVETAEGFENLRALAHARGVSRLAFGALDFCLDLGLLALEEADDGLSSFRLQMVMASRLAGLAAPIDGVTVNIQDDALVTGQAAQARRLGFGAKLCIHPRQVALVNAALSPSDAELAWARRVMDAMADAGAAATAVDGKMVDRPVLARAEAWLAQAGH
jgi:citrate lyase subunit beta/citryl-CoA lyase